MGECDPLVRVQIRRHDSRESGTQLRGDFRYAPSLKYFIFTNPHIISNLNHVGVSMVRNDNKIVILEKDFKHMEFDRLKGCTKVSIMHDTTYQDDEEAHAIIDVNFSLI